MQKINIPILGLTTAGEARGVKDGECRVLHNLTADSGGTRIIAPPTAQSVEPLSRSKEYFHEKVGQWLYLNLGRVEDEQGNKINADGSVDDLSFMGNIVVLYCADGVRYAIYDDGYRYLGKLPSLPPLSIGIKPVHVTTLSDEKYYSDDAEISASDEGLRWTNASKGYFDECLSGLYSQGAFIDRTLFRWAIRLFDGSYVCYSPVYYVEDSDSLIENIGYIWLGRSHSIGRDNKNFFSTARDITGATRSQYFTSVRGFVPSFNPGDYNFERWRDIIVAIELFATPSIMGYENRNSNKLNVKSEYLDTGSVTGTARVNLTTVDSYDRYEWKGAKKIREEVADASLFYKIAEFDLQGNEVWRLDNTSPSQLAVQTRLPVNEQPHELCGASYRYIYNGKMHLAGVSERFADAYTNYAMAARSATDEGVIQITSVVTLGTEQGERRVITTSKKPPLSKQGDNYLLPPLLHYADARAKNLRICIVYSDGYTDYAKYKDFPLTAHKTLNMAYFWGDANIGNEHSVEITNNSQSISVEVDDSSKENAFVAAVKDKFPGRNDYTGTYVFTFNSSSSWGLKVTFSDNTSEEKSNVHVRDYALRLYCGGTPIIIFGAFIKEGETITVKLDYGTGTLAGLKPIEIKGWSNLTSDDATFSFDANDNLVSFSLSKITEKRDYTRRNVMRVSQVDNPLFFPAKSTYSFDADIVALCSNTVAVSQGQFGQHPLYVFTNEGVWLMSVDTSGAGSYLAQVPCSREICNNAAGVTVTTSGVVFPTSKGLMIINGGEVAEISSALSGLHTPELSRADDAVGRICAVVGREGVQGRVAFLDYLVGAFTAFDYNANLLYVCNAAYDYIYVYNNATGVWSSADGRYSDKVEYSDKLILGNRLRGTNGYEYTRYLFDRNNSMVSDVPALMVTRGCIFSTMDFKRLSEAALRATFYASKMGFYVLGSVDGVAWELVGGRDFCKESPSLCRDVVTSFARSRTYRYFAFAFVGNVRSDARIALIEVAAQTDFKSRIR